LKRRKLLAVFAHPDDETLLAGPILAKYAAEGVEVRLVCASPGDDDREARLERATKALGISAVSALRYEPSKMWPGGDALRVTTPVSADAPLAGGPVQSVAPDLALAPVEDLVGRISGRIDEFQPDAVLTHSPYGDYGHPDHILVSGATVSAFDMRPRDEARLYCLAYPLWTIRMIERWLRLSGKDTSRVGPGGKVSLREAVRAAPRKSGVVNVGKFMAARKAASKNYKDEIAEGHFVMRSFEAAPVFMQRLVLGRAAVTRLRPAPKGRERGLFG
jgi:LmbE family N-acetylglucosaminyl deacetylase